MGSHSLLQGIFPTQGWNPGLQHCRRILYCLSHQGSLWGTQGCVYSPKPGGSSGSPGCGITLILQAPPERLALREQGLHSAFSAPGGRASTPAVSPSMVPYPLQHPPQCRETAYDQRKHLTVWLQMDMMVCKTHYSNRKQNSFHRGHTLAFSS